MCDYSLLGIPNRLACEGEDLVVCKFKTGSLGLTPATSTSPAQGMWGRGRAILTMLRSGFATEPIAACVPPGARLLLCDIPTDVQRACSVGPIEEVIFTQLTATPYQYRDAVRFHNAHELLFQELKTGQRLHVLQLSLAEEPAPAVESSEVLVPRRTGVDLIAPRSFGAIPRARDLR